MVATRDPITGFMMHPTDGPLMPTRVSALLRMAHSYGMSAEAFVIAVNNDMDEYRRYVRVREAWAGRSDDDHENAHQ